MFRRKSKTASNRRKKIKNVTLKELAEQENVDIFRVDKDGAVKLMANEILGVPTYVKIGHKNGNPFDNRKCNLYIIDPERN
jgi:hypothetical protein